MTEGWVFPGDALLRRKDEEEEEEAQEGCGCAVEVGRGAWRDDEGRIRASIFGRRKDIEVVEDDDDGSGKKKRRWIRIEGNAVDENEEVDLTTTMTTEATNSTSMLPKVGDVVFCKCVRVMEKTAIFDVLVCNGRALDPSNRQRKRRAGGGKFSGIVRKQDVRKKEIDKVVLEESFVPGDIVRCRVLALGDGRSLVLTTNENPLGVVWARCKESGKVMVAMNWREMMCPRTGDRELRKVAKIDEVKDFL